MPHRPITTLVVLMTAVLLSLPAAGQEKAFTQDQIQSMLRAGLADESGAKLIEERGIDFPPTEDFLQGLKTAGAKEAFLQALRFAKRPGANNTTVFNPSDQSYYLGAKPLLDYPLQDLIQTVTELRGLEPSQGQDELAAILDKTGKVCEDLMERMPNLISREEVTQEKLRDSGKVKEHRRRKFEYMIIVSRNDGNVTLNEYRVGPRGSPAEGYGSGHGYMLTQNFASQWLYFISQNQPAARFLYLGQQTNSGHKCYVVAFAQKPGFATVTGMLIEAGRSVRLLFQGIAWIDEESFRIVRLRTDLLAPRPEIGLQKETTQLQFGMEPLRKIGSSLWLPQQVVVTAERNNQRSRNTHRYSDYRLFKVESRILSAPPDRFSK